MKVFKIEAQGDTIYIQAGTYQEALDKMFQITGPIPLHLMSYKILDELPNGEEFFGA
jgi:hypothetical protein